MAARKHERNETISIAKLAQTGRSGETSKADFIYIYIYIFIYLYPFCSSAWWLAQSACKMPLVRKKKKKNGSTAALQDPTLSFSSFAKLAGATHRMCST